MAQGHFTADEWDDYVRRNFGTIPEAEKWRNENNVFVDGLPKPTYTGPLSSGGSAGAKPQGTTSMDPEDDSTDMAQGALPGPLPFKSVGEWSQGMQGLAGEQAAYGKQRDSERAAQYEAARKALAERRFGPSASEQLFALSAAIGTPMIRPSFGGVMRNVASTMADISRADREAQANRADALSALEQSYASGNDAAKMAEFRARREAMAPMGAVLARMAKPAGNPVWSESLGRFVPRDQVVAIKSGSITSGPYKGGTAVQYSDGSHEVRMPSGQTLRFGPDGQPITPQGGQ